MLKSGKGKTILASRVVAELKDSMSRRILFFYFKKDDPLRNSHVAMLKGLLAQLIRLSPDILPYIYAEVSASIQPVFDSPDNLMMFLDTVLSQAERLWLVIDGLDECEKKERKKIISWISKIISDHPLHHIKVFMASQDTPDIRRAVSQLLRPFTISMHEPGHQDDIRTYASRKAAKRKKQFRLSTETEQDIVHRVTRQANGTSYFPSFDNTSIKLTS